MREQRHRMRAGAGGNEFYRRSVPGKNRVFDMNAGLDSA
jgi:hypothetical protein